MEWKITVFTPTYNRAYTLPRLYQSLLMQTDKRFIWLIVDDGSTDDTNELVKNWIQENKVTIHYEYQENQGKSMAHNRGVELTKTELFTCVDSDDFLTETAIEELLTFWKNAQEDNVGILSRCSSSGGEAAVFKPMNIPKDKITSTILKNAYDKLGLVGDTMLVYRTDIISKYAFPKFEGESFVPESYLYDQIDQEGTLMVLDKAFYICEYLEDGYTRNMAKLLKKNPQGYLAYINQRLGFDKTFKNKASDTIRYTAMSIATQNKHIVRNAVYPKIAFFTYALGWFFYQKRYARI